MVGTPISSGWLDVSSAAKESHDDGIAAVRPGVSHAEVDQACREALRRHGRVESPLHPSGHNVGLSVHEKPYLSPYSTSSIKEGYVLTVEPGVYDSAVGGCRIEDVVVVTRDGCDVLSAP